MSRRSQELSREAEACWPNLVQFLGGYLHQDWPEQSGTPEAAVDEAVHDWDLAGRQSVLREWRDWNAMRGWKNDMRSSIEFGLGVNVHFECDEEARAFMNLVHDKLIASVRAETSKD